MAALLAATLLAIPAAATAQSARDLRDAERTAQERRQAADAAVAEARRRAAEEVRLADRRVEAARVAQEAEEALVAARARAVLARRAGEEAAAAVRARAEAFRPLLPVMLRLAVWPAETVLAVPAPPEEALRGAMVLRGMVRRLEEEAAALRQAQDAAGQVLAVARAEEAALAQAERLAREASATVEAELAAARRARELADDQEDRAADRAQAAAAQARDLAEMMRRLEIEQARREAQERADATARATAAARRQAEAERERRLAAESRQRPPREAAAPAPPAAGGRALPVAGRITTLWGERTAAGPHRGLTFGAPPNSRIVSPCNGRVAFAAPFRSFGLLLIVDCGGGYHFVLAGLDRLDTAVGQRLLAGEPVGMLGGAGDAGASLYVELRRNGQPVDPRPWFAARG